MGTSRLTIFLPALHDGGAERVMVTLANAFAARGPHLADVSPAVRVVDLKAGRVLMAILPLARHLRRERPQALLAAMTHANVAALLARRLSRAPVRVVVSERSTIGQDHRRARGLAARINYALVPRTYPWADGVCTVSRAASADLERFSRLSPGQVQTIYNPFELARIERLAAEAAGHSWLDAGQPPVVLAIGRLTEQKDFFTLVRAFATLRQGRRARLAILGEGEDRAALERLVAELGLAQDDVQLPGYVRNPFAWLARCALFVLSSRWEGLPGVLIEALACGVPVVSTDCPSGPDEILEGGRWGRLVPVGDAPALAQAMADTLDTPRHRLPDGRLRAQDFEPERAVDAYLQLLGLPLRADALP